MSRSLGTQRNPVEDQEEEWDTQKCLLFQEEFLSVGSKSPVTSTENLQWTTWFKDY
jgi:hypothetical protein